MYIFLDKVETFWADGDKRKDGENRKCGHGRETLYSSTYTNVGDYIAWKSSKIKAWSGYVSILEVVNGLFYIQ